MLSMQEEFDWFCDLLSDAAEGPAAGAPVRTELRAGVSRAGPRNRFCFQFATPIGSGSLLRGRCGLDRPVCLSGIVDITLFITGEIELAQAWRFRPWASAGILDSFYSRLNSASLGGMGFTGFHRPWDQ